MDERTKRVKALLRARRWAEAEACVGEAALSGAGPETWLLRALARGELGDLRGARSDLREARARGAPAEEARALFCRFGLVEDALSGADDLSFGRIALAFGRHREGLAALRRAARDSPLVAAELSARLSELGDHEGALDALPAGEAFRHRRARLSWALGRRDEAWAMLAEGTVSEARLALELGAVDVAARLGEGVPNDAEGALLRAELACLRGAGKEARRWAETALALEADRRVASRLRGIGRWLAGEEGARSDLDQAILLGGDPEALLWRAEIHRSEGRLEAALSDCERGITATEGYPVAGHACRLCIIIAMQHADAEILHRDAYAELFDLLAPIIGPHEGALTSAEVRAQLEEALRAMAGNRSAHPTFVRDGKVLALETPIHTRFSSRSLQEGIRARPVEAVVADLESLHRARPEPTVICHIGEIYLWLGESERARETFLRALASTAEVRWAYVGLAAAELLAGDLDEALAWCARGEERFPPPGRTMFAYRAEIYRQRGEITAARADLEVTLRDTPERISAWLNLVLLEPALEGEVLRRLRRRAPGLLADASRALTGDEIFEGDRAALFEQILTMMRGNRSSSFVTYFADGELRFVPMTSAGTRAV